MTKLLNKKGFTLIELMVVIVIVGILAAVAIPKFTHASHKAKCSELPTVVMSMFTGASAYQQETTDQSFTGLTMARAGLQDPTSSSKWFRYGFDQITASNFNAYGAAKVAFGGVAVGDSIYINATQTKVQDANYDNYILSWE